MPLRGLLLLVLPLAGCGGESSGPANDAPLVSGFHVAWHGGPATSRGSTIFAAGDTVEFVAEASDPEEQLAWVGFRIEPPFALVESVSVPDSLSRFPVQLTVSLVSDPSDMGVMRVSVFARDRSGGRTEVVPAGPPPSLYQVVSRATMSTPLSVPVADLVLDAKRWVVYLSQPDSGRVGVLSLATMTFLPPLLPPGAPGSLDLTAGDDSLLVTIRSLRAVAVADLTTVPTQWSLLPLSFDTSGVLFPKTVRVSGRNKALVFLGPPPGYSGAWGRLLEYDLASGAQRMRTDVQWSNPGVLTALTPMVRSQDRSRILLLFDGSCCPETGQIYASQADTFLTRRPTVEVYGAPLSVSANGNRFLVARTLFDANLDNPIPFNPPGDWRASALSPAGDTAYFKAGAGVFRTQVADGATLQLVRLPEPPVQLVALPHPGERLLVVMEKTISLVDLGAAAASSFAAAPRHASPPAVAWRALLRRP